MPRLFLRFCIIMINILFDKTNMKFKPELLIDLCFALLIVNSVSTRAARAWTEVGEDLVGGAGVSRQCGTLFYFLIFNM